MPNLIHHSRLWTPKQFSMANHFCYQHIFCLKTFSLAVSQTKYRGYSRKMALTKPFITWKKFGRAFFRPDFSKEAPKTHFSKSYKALFSPGRSILFAKSAKIPFFTSFAMQTDTKSDFLHFLQCKLIRKRFFDEFAMQIFQNAIFMNFLQCKFIAKLISRIICNAKR